MYDNKAIETAKKLKDSGYNLSQISNQIGVSRSTLRDWFSEGKRYIPKKAECRNDDFFRRFEDSKEVREAYYYILGQYLGDGCISPNSRTYRLRISATIKYANIITTIKKSLQLILPHNSIYETVSNGCTAVTINSNSLPEIFPQHGIGRKHEREIKLVEWQLKYLEENSKHLARGLFHSDGCRYAFSKDNLDRCFYSFVNCSTDIHQIYQECLKLNNILFTVNDKVIKQGNSPAWSTLIYRKSEVDKAFAFLGEKS